MHGEKGGARWQHNRGKRQILLAHDWTWARLTAAAGITFVVLAVAGFVVRGVPPSPGEPLADARAYYLDHRTGVLTFVFLDCLAMFCLVAFAAGHGGLVARRGGEPWGILARLMLAGTIGGAGITMMLDMTEAALAARTPARWHRAGWGWLALLPAAGAIVGAAGLGNPGDPVAIAGLVGGYIPMLLWMIAMSIALFVRREDSIPAVGEQTTRAGNQLWQLKA